MYDIVLKNGSLFDGANGFDGQVCDVAAKDGRICKIAETICEPAAHEVDVEGRAIVPGLIDFHAHFFSGGTITSLEFSSYLATGVTNAVDAGSAGAANVESFLGSLSEKERRNTRLYLNLASEGLACLGDHSENINPLYFNESRILRLCSRYPEHIIGLKLRISGDIARLSRTTSFDSLRRGVEIAEKCGLPLSVHMPDFQGELKELIDILRPGDIFCHVFTPRKGIMENGILSEEIIRGRKKGIVLESACGKGHLGHAAALAAMQKQVFPDIVSGDFTRNTFTFRPAVSLPYLMSRFMAMGMPLLQILACCTAYPARKMGMEGRIGCLREGAAANLAVFDRLKGEFAFEDVEKHTVIGGELLRPAATLWEGEMVYNNLPYAD